MIRVTHHGDLVRLTVIGNLVAGGAEKELLARVEEHTAAGVVAVEVDFEEVGFVDSSGLGALVRSHATCGAAGARLRLAHVNPQLMSLLRIARLDDVLEIAADGGS